MVVVVAVVVMVVVAMVVVAVVAVVVVVGRRSFNWIMEIQDDERRQSGSITLH